jgi:hypothetical protein
MSRTKKKKLTKNKKKFFIILACYVVLFVLTSVITASTLAWYNSSTWQSDVLYMGGPVYIYFSDDSGVTRTSGAGKLVSEMPADWTHLYPGMNIKFEAKAVIEGHTFENIEVNTGETFIQYTTTAVLRAKIRLDVVDPNGNNQDISKEAKDIYDAIWHQLRDRAKEDDPSNEGIWIMDVLDETKEENNYYYYVNKSQTFEDSGDYKLTEVGGLPTNVSVGFLNNAIITLPGVEILNKHADCRITFTIVFEAVQAFFPYEEEDIGTDYQGDTTGRSDKVVKEDLGLEKPLIVANSRKLFNESMWTPENGWPVEP